MGREKGIGVPDHRLRNVRALGIPAVLALAFTMGCGPNEDTGAGQGKPDETATAGTPAAPSPAVTANGVEKLGAAEILKQARKATASAKYMRVHGRVADEEGRMTLDFRYAGKAKSTGWFTIGAQRVEITRVGSDIYFQGNAAFWTAIGEKAAYKLFKGKFIKTTADNADFKDLAAFTDRTGLFDEVVKAAPGWKKGETGKAGGTPSVVLTSSAGDRIQVATQGRPYVLSMDGGQDNHLEYSAYGQPMEIRRPPARDVVDLEDFA